MTTALITHDDVLGHATPPGHPEQVARMDAVLGALEGMDLRRVKAPMAAEADLLRVHPRAHLDRVAGAVPEAGTRALDADTHVSPGSLAAAWRAAGAVIRGVDMVLAGEAGNAFAAVRPPGHHAETETPMGFCLFGSVAAAAKHALDHHGLSRVAVVDFDVHHGNGTQDLLWDEARALVISSHQMPLWPGTGRPDETGAFDTVVNRPLPPDSDGAEMRRVYEAEIFPRLRDFAPQLILVSAGFDAHRADPLAQLNWDEADFAWLIGKICEIARETCGGRVVSALEGGYDLEALGASVAAHVTALMENAR
ncbi:histone deacetylase family protein [Salibaculum halophilum]|uniref:histone deacetylase family protein n=1 Tax=Salibaculum halophilum TaxID=1914408 RepID=UPI000A121A5D|nr:histone deacetylase family protein [Salibaculum halophilum]